MEEKYAYYQSIVGAVDEVIAKVRDLPLQRCYDMQYLEHEFIPSLGLNNEQLEQQPPELGAYFGRGLHLWQYPSQLANYLVWLAHNAKSVHNYTEIGCRWGGTFILVNEWLKRIGAPIEFSLAIDPIAPTPFIQRYREISSSPIIYLEAFSTSEEVKKYFATFRPEMVFIDGDHSLHGVMFDHLLVRTKADIIVHHDVTSDGCPATTLFWSYLKQAETDFDHWEFGQQYDSVQGNFLGLGVLKKKA
ncbi:hypothetical protein [Rhizobium oryzicola]|uniref:Class I SAM-dependent methyltransferase n=1 Tax=Rhizobium oryzicola TaxID=1232668 RepID=A0ABT8SVY4_9HYPH|nr:hypothetical protein [Rhizobium oryzicola]MDO1582213.1 hypothetical protein [Rhizobium oryzicola]